jgi:hypothetical protein
MLVTLLTPAYLWLNFGVRDLDQASFPTAIINPDREANGIPVPHKPQQEPAPRNRGRKEGLDRC